ncbi:bifunctional 4-hydroxy-2-oxoglutarate aldolase/2-dehydro-3-deoxy-phosphogluconate aldolase [Bifidobacterium sp. 82T24]|uniref:2-dehydro-3-deoxy-phosphogluconate aldolase n=2 Tax=Bifidobacterium TaxID=1678 RepID=A0A2M9H995_9BIFI|nr:MULTISPECIES: bifunctional 4-hydroxy-2-oxoglutarate aldolase/2-dehydro-3-deoxy-phosphogluconate aldolase [Bifidobacterium]MBW3088747.1 bifunctional 4-hydroxy-2-oxoglutarate aldolase/2-dehydro-3-deoxy-phosphogluconate aldolase [Bifidobacterium pluvialisilvae]NEG96368.1 bifunctional 4-hydroxy-2-oxoglutarate aldolase/2-dehydro-3-deoxy-phosphogluconate aldolase [Bifidobacterium sp. SMB2]NEH11000.1 bifunctional 4-hydroxy-2-oxoglutarate aldolase/2-dehydro-3-deoxy-phosphogluconate aldolase [Bifidoba
MADKTNEEQLAYFSELGVVPLVTLHSVEEAVPLAQALERGGIPVAEVTFRSPYAIEGMKRIRDEVPGVTLVAGTVHTVEQAKASIEAGCKGLVTPAFTRSIVDYALENDILVLPGTAVPSDVDDAYQLGLRYVKFFPAEAYGGVKTLKALNGPFAEMKFLPTGGVSLKNAEEYISLNNVFAIGGSFPVPSAAQKAHDWDAIAQACADARALVKPIIDKKNA